MKSSSIVTKTVLFGMLVILILLVLSTATYAWYSTVSVVEAGRLTFHSSVENSAGGVSIGKTRTSLDSSVSFDAVPKLSPMIPHAEAVSGETEYADFIGFRRSYEGLDELGRAVALLDGAVAAPHTLALGGQEYFYINNNTDGDLYLSVQYEIEGELASKMHIALFVGDEGVFELIMTESAVHYGEIKVGDAVSAMPVMNGATASSGEKSVEVRANSSITLRLVVWLDGVDMKDADSNKTTVFNVKFTA